jgi:hypothetical protein|tara:strand:+ start:3539 stop:3712 length:174 start_codon:yes stop_codon:yes gene_type:complete
MSQLKIFLIMFYIGIVLFLIGIVVGFKDGQIKAINGDIQYELKINPDKSTTWIKKGN